MSEERKIQFRKETRQDEALQEVIEMFNKGWPNNKKEANRQAQKYWKVRQDLSVSDGLVFKEEKIVVPQSLRAEMLVMLHEGHFGTEKTKACARQVLYWPGMNRDIEEFIDRCMMCEIWRRKNPKEQLKSHEVPKRSWQRVAADILEYGGESFLVIVDAFSKWIELKQLKHKTTIELVKHFKEVFAVHGVPDVCMSDNMPFNSKEFLRFTNEWGFSAITSSPNFPQSNGLAEKVVGIAKNILRKGDDISLALLEYRNSPIVAIGFSPAQILFNRRLKDKLPVTSNLLKPVKVDKEVEMKLTRTQESQKRYYDRGSKNLEPLVVKENILINKNKEWIPGQVMGRHELPRSYIVKDIDNTILRRNRRHLRKSRNKYNQRSSEQLERDQIDEGQQSRNQVTKSERPGIPEREVHLDKSEEQLSAGGGKIERPRRDIKAPQRLKDFVVRMEC